MTLSLKVESFMLVFSSTRLDFFMLSEQYLEEFCQMDMDAEVMKFYTSRPHGTREQAVASFDRYKVYMEKFPKLGGFMAFTKDTKEFVGLGVFIHLELNPENNKYELGYRLPTHQWSKGYATEIANRLLEYGFHDLGMTEIYGTINPENIVSGKVLLKIGMKEVGYSTNYGGSTVFKISREDF